MSESNQNKDNKNCFALLQAATTNLFHHNEILKPFILLIFIQIIILEILYFAPRFPFNIFFGPIITKLWSESFLHYPLNFALLPKLYQYTQFPVYIFLSSFLIGIALKTMVCVNNSEEISTKKIIKFTLNKYVHIITAAIISFLLVMATFKLYNLIYDRALLIRSTTGKFYILKMIFVYGAPYFNLLLSVLVTTILGYVIPIIIVEDKKIFSALIENFKILSKSFALTFLIVLIPSLLFVPVLLLRNSLFLENIMPELSVLMLVLTIIVMVLIDAIAYTTLTTLLLLKKENK